VTGPVERGAPRRLADSERHQVLVEWNRTAVDHRPEATIHELFAEEAAKRPDAPAVVAGSTVLTYRELDLRSNRLARILVERGVGPDVPVGLAAKRTPEVVVALLGILKAGGAYLPLDPAYPRDRIAWMLEDARVPVVVGDTPSTSALPETKASRLLLDAEAAAIAAKLADPVRGGATAESLAYVMYTSGSTGRPKGTLVRHRAVNRLVRAVDYVALGPDETLLFAAPLAFDASTFEIWGALLNGGRVAIHPEAVPTARGLAESIRRHGVTTMWLTAALFNMVIDEDPQALSGLRQLLTGGEALSVPHVRRALQALPSVRLINGYGPTECTTFTTCHTISRPLPEGLRSIPIGRPIRDTSVYVLDADRQPVAPGEPGELYVGGEGLARGYLNRPDLTAERFVPDTVSGAKEARLYRTGDLVRWLPDGTIEYLGRADEQVKIRGFRIEPGEIEAALLADPALKTAAVVAREDRPGAKRLVAYLVARPGAAQPVHADLRKRLAKSLPEAMVPSAFVWMDALPVTANGKLDRRALPPPPPTRPALAQEYVAPASELEVKLGALWADVLGVEPVGRDDGFFDLGGSSLLAVRMVSRVRDELGIDVPLVQLFDRPTLSGFAAAAAAASTPAAPAAAPGVTPARPGSRREGRVDVAVVGMAGRFPGAADVDLFWKNLVEGVDGTTFFSDTELDPTVPEDQRRDPAYVRARGILEGADLFDAAFFGMGPREAEITDPQNRLFLETAWEALERSGHVPASFAGPIGVFGGKYNNTYFERNVATRPDLIEAFGAFNTMAANEKDYVATRAAFKLDLTGPAVSIHTACSTSLVAICAAVESLRRGECDLALAGGSSVTVPVRSGHVYQEGSMLSSDGRTRPFDAGATGTTFSDGVAVVVLRRLEDARRDGDQVYAVIRGTAVNNDGARKASFTAPSVEGQAAVVAMAQADAEVDARSISYVETHGTATPLGDPIEVEALSRTFRRATADRGFCGIGSVKSNVGHLTIAAGATGFIKTALSLHNETLPATIHFQTPNPALGIEKSPFFVVREITPWKRGGEPRRAGVSAFGVGGTNAHVVLEEAPPQEPSGPGRPKELLVLSARTPEALDASCARLAAWLREHPDASVADVAHTLQTGRAGFAHRRFLVAGSAADAAAQLAEPKKLAGRKLDAKPFAPVFLFPGQGSQYVRMGEELLGERVFRRELDRVCDVVRPFLERDLRDVLYPAAGGEEAAAEILRATAYTQPALFAIEWALACQWRHWGVEPVAMAGHSVGEFVCAAIAGVMAPEDAAALVAERGRLIGALPPGAMLSVNMSAEGALPLLDDPMLAIASENAPGLCVVAGPAEAVARVQKRLDEQKIVCRPLHTSHAFHSPMMDPAVPVFAEKVRRVRLSPPRIPFVSTVTGAWITPEQAQDPSYWSRHLRETVRFAAAAAVLVSEPGRLFLEVGPRTTLTTLTRRQVKDILAKPLVSSLADQAGSGVESAALLGAVGQLWANGVALDWKAFREGERRRRLVLPTYPFERKRFWIEPARAARAEAPSPAARAAEAPLPAAPVSAVAAAPAPQPAASSTVATTQPEPNMNAARKDKIAADVRELFEEVSGLEIGDADSTFVEMGMDSLFLTQAALQLQKKFGLKVTFRQLMENFPNVAALTDHLDTCLPADAYADAAPAPAAAPTPAPVPVAVSAAPAPALAAPVAVPAAAFQTPAPSTAPAGSIQHIVEEQLRLMANQLALLGFGPAVAQAQASPPAVAVQTQAPAVVAPAPAPVATVSAPPPPAAKPANGAAAKPANGAQRPAEGTPEEGAGAQKYDVKKAFGAIAKIHLTADEMSPRQRARLDAFIRRYVARTKTSKRLTQENRTVLADPRVVTGFKPTIKEIVYQVVVDRSQGARVWDVDGNEYVDCLNGFGASYFGWQPPFVTEAVKRQLDRGHEIGPMTPVAYDAARLLCELTGMERAGFCNTGSEAVMGCMRIARTVTGRTVIASFTGDYHGIFDEVIVRGTKKLKAVPAAPGIMPSSSQNMLILDYGTAESLEIIRQRADELAAVLVEPVQSRRPDFRPKEFLKEVREITRKSGTALIFDEVITGFRVAPGGAQAYYGIQADLASYGKVIGGGFPIGVIAGHRPWMDALDGGPWQYGDDSTPTAGVTYFAGTFCRHPLALAAMRAVMEHVKAQGPALQEGMNQKTAKLAADLNAHFQAVGVPIEIRSFSALWKLFFTQDLPYGELLFPMLRDRGLHILEGFPCFLTTAHGDAEVAFIVKAFREAIAEMQEAGFLPEAPKRPAVDPSTPPVPGARLGRDPGGNPAWFVENPKQPGQWLKVSDA